MNPLNDRRQRALEAGLDAIDATNIRSEHAHGIAEAIEVATRVKITGDLVDAVRTPWMTETEMREALATAFRAAGFEVIE